MPRQWAWEEEERKQKQPETCFLWSGSLGADKQKQDLHSLFWSPESQK